MFDSAVKRSENESEAVPLAGVDQRDELRSRWKMLCSEFLPLYEPGSLWRHRRGWRHSDPKQGWKVHISATILTACDVLQAVATFLTETGVAFKAAASLNVLERLNAGIFHGYSQVGKCITIYPADDDQFREIVARLYELILNNAAAPAIPFEFRYFDSNIYYRYGSFITKPGEKPLIRRPDGENESDRRSVACPDWVQPPLGAETYKDVTRAGSPLTSRYRIVSAISQRGKGGVYKAIRIKPADDLPVIIKEGRRHGETTWDGRDGRSRVENEVNALRELRAAGVDVPIVYEFFEVGDNFYAILEQIPGSNLGRITGATEPTDSPVDTVDIYKQISRLLANVHAARWVWRDCKPANLLLTPGNTVRPVDFEGAHRADQPDPQAWSSPSFSSPELFDPNYARDPRFPFAEDLYSLGVTLFFINKGTIYKANNRLVTNTPRCNTDPSDCYADSGGCHVDEAECDADYAKGHRDTYECRCNPERAISPKSNFESSLYRLLSENPADRPSAGEVYEGMCLIEAHLNE